MTTRAKPVTYDDYLTLPNDGKKYEIIDGELIMTPSPISVRQRISRNLFRILDNFVSENKSYRSVGTFKENDVVELKTIEGLSVKLSEVFG